MEKQKEFDFDFFKKEKKSENSNESLKNGLKENLRFLLACFVASQAAFITANLHEMHQFKVQYHLNLQELRSLQSNITNTIRQGNINEIQLVFNVNEMMKVSSLGSISAISSIEEILNNEKISNETKTEIIQSYANFGHFSLDKEAVNFSRMMDCHWFNLTCQIVGGNLQESYKNGYKMRKEIIYSHQYYLTNPINFDKHTYQDYMLQKIETITPKIQYDINKYIYNRGVS